MAPTIFRCFPAPVTKTSNFIQNSRRDKNLITAAVLLIVVLMNVVFWGMKPQQPESGKEQ